MIPAMIRFLRPAPPSILLALCLSSASLPAAAQESVLATSPALSCLTRVAGAAAALEYPPDELARKEGGLLRAELEFAGPDQAPRVTITKRPVTGSFDSEVKAHVAAYRVPCMRPGDAPVRLIQEYHFDPVQQSRVVASATSDKADPERARQLKCMAHIHGEARPAFPEEALKRGEAGTLIMRLHFTSPDAAPTVETVAAVPSRSLRRAVAQHLDGFRVPCLQNQPLDTLITFRYVFDNGARAVLRDSRLIEVLAAAGPLPLPARFDFNTMGCPFELRMSYRQPFDRNQLDQLDTAMTSREPFMRWLEQLTLKSIGKNSAEFFNEKFVITVPCGGLDL